MSEQKASCSSCEVDGSTPSSVPPDDSGTSFKIHGMDCAEEVAVLKRALADLVAEEALTFDVLTGRMTARAAVDDLAIMDAVSATGMRAERWTTDRSPNAERSRFGLRDLLVVTSIAATIGGFTVHAVLEGGIGTSTRTFASRPSS
jgi:Cd2+/Zn2+-exporting ATPase